MRIAIFIICFFIVLPALLAILKYGYYADEHIEQLLINREDNHDA